MALALVSAFCRSNFRFQRITENALNSLHAHLEPKKVENFTEM
jgi:hypothetical protein